MPPAVLRAVRCYHCGHAFEVSSKAGSTVCSACQQRVVLEDVVVDHLMPVALVETCGRVVVRKKGSLIASRVRAGDGVEVQGSLKADVVSGGPVLIGPDGRWTGDCRAPALAMRLGARIEAGRFDVGGAQPETDSTVSRAQSGTVVR